MTGFIRALLAVLVMSTFHGYQGTQVNSLDLCGGTRTMEDVIVSLLTALQWNTCSIIFGTGEEIHIPHFLKLQRHNIDDEDIDEALDNIYVSSFPDINVVIVVNESILASTLHRLDRYDSQGNDSTDVAHRGKVMVVLVNNTDLHALQNLLLYLENIAVVVYERNIEIDLTVSITMHTLHMSPVSRVLVPVKLVECESIEDLLYPNLRFGYNNRHLKITTIPTYPYVEKSTVNDSVQYSGYVFDIFNIIAQKLNFSYEVVEPIDRNYGSFEDGQWNGMIAQVLNKEVDLAVADITLDQQRSLYVDFIVPGVMVDRTDIIYRRRDSSEMAISLLLGPLRTEVYIVFVAVCAGVMLLYNITDDIAWAAMRALNMTCHPRRVSAIMCEFLRTIFKQEFRISPKTSSAKVLLASWWLLLILVTSAYSANLIAALSFQSSLSKISSIDQLVDSAYTHGVYKSGVSYTTLMTSDRPELRRLFAKMLEQSRHDSGIISNDQDAHIARVKDGGHSYVIYRSLAERLLAEDCNLALIGEPVTWSEEHISFALPKNSPLKYDIDRIMSTLSDNGILDHLWKKWTTSQNAPSCVTERKITAITLEQMAGGILVACGSVVIAILVLVFEICWNRSHRAMSRNS